MIHKLKVLGLAFVAIAALSAVASSAAQAGTLQIPGTQSAVVTTPEKAETELVTLSTAGNPVTSKCKDSTLEGTITAEQVTEATVTATYAECTAFGVAATVRLNGCKYTITGISGGVNPAETAWVDITGCTAGKKIEIKSAICTITIGEQNTLSHLTFTNVAGPPKHLQVHATAGGITATQDGAGCPDGNNHTAARSSFTGTTTLKAFEDAGTKQVTKHEHQYLEFLCGAQKNLIAS